jgi:hypothetical protein
MTDPEQDLFEIRRANRPLTRQGPTGSRALRLFVRTVG